MVVKLNNGEVHIISSMEDVRELIDGELFEAILELTNIKLDTYESKLEDKIYGLEHDIEDLEDDVNSYSSSCENVKSVIFEANDKIDTLINYIEDTEELDKDKIIDDLHGINEILDECEGY